MKKLSLLLALLLTLALCPALAETVNPYMETAVDNPGLAPLVYTGVDFGAGASLLRIKGETDSELLIRVYLDSTEGNPVVKARLSDVVKENRLKVSIGGVHDLYFVFEGEGVFTSWQAFTSQADIDAAIRAERGVRYEDLVPAAYTRQAEQRGTIEKFTYQAHDYFNGGALYEKNAFVYLPYGYGEAQTYDLLILCHGIGGSEYEWGMVNEDSKVKRIMDNLIQAGEIRPFIVVTPNGRAGKTEDQSSFYSFDQELRNDLLPALAEKYAVDIADRNRCAMAGLSMGGMQTINLGVGKCLDLFSAFGAFSACPTTNPAAITAATLTAHPELPVRVFYSICGSEDTIARASSAAAVDALEPMTEQLNEKNFVLQHVTGGHDFGVWYLGFYNFARLIGEK
jgi:endo-1,4-beta-xylanase